LAAVLHTAKWLRTAVLQPSANQPRPHSNLLARLQLTNSHLDRLVREVGAKFKSVNVQLEDNDPTVAVRFPGGERQIAQRNQR
jgi:hypothetical protein